MKRWASLFCLLVATTSVAGNDERLPVPLQVAMFKRIFGFDRDLAGKPLEVLVVYKDEGVDADAVVATFTQVGIPSRKTPVTTLPATLPPGAVVYAFKTALTPAVRDLSTKSSALSVSPEGQAARNGDVCVALGRNAEGKPEIIINLQVARREGHTFAAQLLSLESIIKIR